MRYLIISAVAVVLFFVMPWLAIAFDWYCNTVNRFMQRRKGCGPACSEMHTETGRCEIARNR